MRKFTYYVTVIVGFLLITAWLISLPSRASIKFLIADQKKTTTVSDRPQAPETGTPEGDPTPAATRPEQNCPETTKPLTALFANNGSDFTVSEYPVFWFYIPNSVEEIEYMEFLVQSAQDNQVIYHQAVKLTDSSGVIQISLADDSKSPLALDENYRWHFNVKLNCADSYQVVKGWIRRVPITSDLENKLETNFSQRYLVYQEEGIWYDAIALLAKLHFSNPNNQDLNLAWTKLTEYLQLSWVSQEPLVNIELLPPRD